MAKPAARPIPEGYPTVTSYMAIKNAERAIDFYKRAFGATEVYRMKSPDGKTVVHAEIKIGDTTLMLGEEKGGGKENTKSAETLRGSPVGFYLYVNDSDQAFKKAVDAGAKEKHPIRDMFWGDRSGTVVDPFGFHWTIATRREDLSAQEIEERAKAA